MPTIFLIADTHFGHAGVTRFLNQDGSKLRPWDNVEDMDEAMIQRWNEVVGQKDKVYHLGDVVINRRCLPTLSRLNGEKVLIKGNHDIFRLNEYAQHFKDVRAYHVLDMLLLSHIPVHPESKGRFRGNVHGHLHSRKLDDPWYRCVSVEHLEYRPIPFEVVRREFKERS